jgi:hypothetical protein
VVASTQSDMHQYVVERRGKSTIVIVPRKKKQTDVTFLADVYNADCSVTGTSWGAPSTPKYHFSRILRNYLPKGQGYGWSRRQVCRIHTDNAGPHQDSKFINGVKG